MFSNKETELSLKALGGRLKMARLHKGDSQAIFSTRLGVSVPTLRDLENGEPTVSVGTWLAALWMLSRLRDLDSLLEEKASLFDRAPAKTRLRVRAQRRTTERTNKPTAQTAVP